MKKVCIHFSSSIYPKLKDWVSPPYQCLQSVVPSHPHVPSNHPPPARRLGWLKESGALSVSFLSLNCKDNQGTNFRSFGIYDGKKRETKSVNKSTPETFQNRNSPRGVLQLLPTSPEGRLGSNMVPGHPT